MSLPVANTKTYTLMPGPGCAQKDMVDEAKRIIKGYAATNDVDTIRDQIVPGAFKITIADRGPRMTDAGIRSKIKVALDHKKVIGLPQLMREDPMGLYTESYVDLGDCGDEVLAQVKSGTLDAMSFYYDILDDAYDPSTGIHLLKQLKVWEYGPVYFPCNELAIITGIKSLRDARAMLEAEKPEELIKLLGDLKAGRVFSAVNMANLTRIMGAVGNAMDALQELMAQAGGMTDDTAPEPDPDDMGMGMSGKSEEQSPPPERPPTSEDEQVKSALEALTAGAKSFSEQLKRNVTA